MKIFHDDFGNTAKITERNILPYRGATQTEKGYVLSITADYDNDFLYYVSVFESVDDAIEKLKQFSCNTWKVA